MVFQMPVAVSTRPFQRPVTKSLNASFFAHKTPMAVATPAMAVTTSPIGFTNRLTTPTTFEIIRITGPIAAAIAAIFTIMACVSGDIPAHQSESFLAPSASFAMIGVAMVPIVLNRSAPAICRLWKTNCIWSIGS